MYLRAPQCVPPELLPSPSFAPTTSGGCWILASSLHPHSSWRWVCCKDVSLYNTRKRYTAIESLDLMRNISWLASCFSKLRNPISIVQEIKVWLPMFAFWHNFTYLSVSYILIWTSTCGSARYNRNIQNRKIQSKRVLGLLKYTHRLADHNKVTQ